MSASTMQELADRYHEALHEVERLRLIAAMAHRKWEKAQVQFALRRREFFAGAEAMLDTNHK